MKRTTTRTKARRASKTDEALLAHNAALRIIHENLRANEEALKTIRHDLANNTCRAAWGVTITQDLAAVKAEISALNQRMDRDGEAKANWHANMEHRLKEREKAGILLLEEIHAAHERLNRLEGKPNLINLIQQLRRDNAASFDALQTRVMRLEQEWDEPAKTGNRDQTALPHYPCPKCDKTMQPGSGQLADYFVCHQCGAEFYP